MATEKRLTRSQRAAFARAVADCVTGQEWRAEAVCAQTDAETFYPENDRWAAPAKRVCAACPVIASCLSYALVAGEQHGVWGGLTETERAVVLAALGGAAVPAHEATGDTTARAVPAPVASARLGIGGRAGNGGVA